MDGRNVSSPRPICGRASEGLLNGMLIWTVAHPALHSTHRYHCLFSNFTDLSLPFLYLSLTFHCLSSTYCVEERQEQEHHHCRHHHHHHYYNSNNNRIHSKPLESTTSTAIAFNNVHIHSIQQAAFERPPPDSRSGIRTATTRPQPARPFPPPAAVRYWSSAATAGWMNSYRTAKSRAVLPQWSLSAQSDSGGEAGRHGGRKTRIFVKPSQTRQGPPPARPAPRWPVFIARVECLGVFWGVSAEAFPFMFWAVFDSFLKI